MPIVNKFVPPHPLNTAVLFLIFNRLDTTKRVFEAIKQAKPPCLYIAADGPRDSKKGEDKIVREVREYVLNSIDWSCEVKTLFREKNLGCGKAVSEAITWFFENEEMGIILEDDCLPSQSFFWFCEELLERYKDDMRVWHIAGNNFHFGWKRDPDYSYYFSYYGSIWGWSTWRSRWNYYNVDMKNYDEIKQKNYLWDLFGNQKEADFRISKFEEIKKGLDTWDFQWVFARLVNSGLSIIPIENLVKNLGFGQDATHTRSIKDQRINMELKDIVFPLKHPPFVIRDKKSDDKYFNEFVKYNRSIIVKKIIKKLLLK